MIRVVHKKRHLVREVKVRVSKKTLKESTRKVVKKKVLLMKKRRVLKLLF